jgi:hypothetical protein
LAKIARACASEKPFNPIETTAVPNAANAVRAAPTNPGIPARLHRLLAGISTAPCQTQPVVETGLANTKEQESDQEASEGPRRIPANHFRILFDERWPLDSATADCTGKVHPAKQKLQES